MILFYAPEIESAGCLADDDAIHCARVLRHNIGDEIVCTDGKGFFYTCRITSLTPKRVDVEVLERREARPHWGAPIVLAVAPTKNSDRLEWLVEKAVEMGVDKIVLLSCRRSERRVMKTERLKRVMISAMKQSLKATLPELKELTLVSDFIRTADGQRFFGYCDSNTDRKDFAREYNPREPVTVMIGPEGDFSPEEVEMALKAGFVPVTFGESRLRTETAGMYAVAASHTLKSLTY